MAAQLFVLTPAAADPDLFPRTLMGVLAAAEVSALLVRRGPRDAATYAAWAQTIINIGQGAGCAVLLEDDVVLAKRLGADGVHLSGDPALVKDAVKALKPALIVGSGPFASRHDAMTIGEMDVDYLLFGALEGTTDANAVDLAIWWADTFEIPAVFSDPAAIATEANAHGAEFLALGEAFWATPEPQKSIAAIAAALEQN